MSDIARRHLLRFAAFAVARCHSLPAVVGAEAMGAGHAAASPRSDGPEFRRGIGIVHPLGWADVTAAGSYVFPPFAGPHRELGLAQMQVLRTAGFDFLRLAVDPGPFLHFDGAQRDWLDARLLDLVRAALDGGFGVIIDFHPSDMNAAYLPNKLTIGIGSDGFRDFCALVRRTASHLQRTLDAAVRRGQHPRLALELLNEPEVSAVDWQPMLEALYRIAREAAPHVPLVVGGGLQNSSDALEALDLTLFKRDTNLIYTFHDYTPWQFTHQGVEGNPALYLTNVPFPPRRGSIEEAKSATKQKIAENFRDARERSAAALKAERDLNQYASSEREGNRVPRTFDRISAWCSANGIPAKRILLGEFGAHVTAYHRTADGAVSRATWIREMREAAEAKGFGWSVWDYVEVGGFGIAEDRDGLTIDRTVSRALGLLDPSNR